MFPRPCPCNEHISRRPAVSHRLAPPCPITAGQSVGRPILRIWIRRDRESRILSGAGVQFVKCELFAGHSVVHSLFSFRVVRPLDQSRGRITFSVQPLAGSNHARLLAATLAFHRAGEHSMREISTLLFRFASTAFLPSAGCERIVSDRWKAG